MSKKFEKWASENICKKSNKLTPYTASILTWDYCKQEVLKIVKRQYPEDFDCLIAVEKIYKL